ncbi:hypothetical protein F4801DRAFT_387782 [Xylaria longipes]|nr:hypothetical protein F4801DRAFT_387782 [Xylaria longipes]
MTTSYLLSTYFLLLPLPPLPFNHTLLGCPALATTIPPTPNPQHPPPLTPRYYLAHGPTSLSFSHPIGITYYTPSTPLRDYPSPLSFP